MLLHEMAPAAGLEDVVARADEGFLLAIRKRARTARTAVQALAEELQYAPLLINLPTPAASSPGTALAVRDEEIIDAEIVVLPGEAIHVRAKSLMPPASYSHRS